MENIIVALIAFVGTVASGIISAIISNSLTKYRLEQLENKVDKHNNLVERMYAVEKEVAVIKEDYDMCPARNKREEG